MPRHLMRGEVVGDSFDGTCWRVKWDNLKTVDTVAKCFIEDVQPE